MVSVVDILVVVHRSPLDNSHAGAVSPVIEQRIGYTPPVACVVSFHIDDQFIVVVLFPFETIVFEVKSDFYAVGNSKCLQVVFLLEQIPAGRRCIVDVIVEHVDLEV